MNKVLQSLVGKTIIAIDGLEQYSDEVIIHTECESEYIFYHEQDCCETVLLEDFEGNELDFIGSTIVRAEEVDNYNVEDYDYYEESHTWCFYKIMTTRGELWMRWLGQSNGYYSEHVSVEKTR